jgi:glycosyltransferase involved in cell wall biosynthesis
MNNKAIDLIYFTLFPWDHPYSSVSLSFTRAFAKEGRRIFYINPPFTFKDLWTRKETKAVQSRRSDQWKRKTRFESIPNLGENVIAVHPPAILPINFLPKGKTYHQLQQWNEKVVLDSIQQAIQKYNIQDYIYFNCFNPSVAGVLPKPFQARLNIYQCIDDMAQETYTAKHWLPLENQVIRDADICIVTSRELKRLKQQLNPNTHILHNAVDDTIFEKALTEIYARPEEIKDVQTPMIGFTGNMDGSRIDYPLLKKIAETHQDKTLVLVGPTNSEDYKTLGLDQMENVIFTGSKDIRELPKYLQHFDCTIIPFLKNTLTASIYPLKINEYLFAGKPVLSTNFSEDIRSFQEVIYLADSHEEFLQIIDRALAEDNIEKKANRVAVARQNTWTHRVQQFWKVVEPALSETMA